MKDKIKALSEFIAQEGLAKICRTEEPLAPHTSFKIGGGAELFVVPKDRTGVQALLKRAKKEEIPCFILGNGSNVLFSDAGKRGLVLCLKDGLDQIAIDGEQIRCGAGALLSAVASEAKEHGLAGLEFAAGIPGSVGGAIYMNAGAYGSEMKAVVLQAQALMPDGTERSFSGEALCFAYRKSVFATNGAVILEATLQLKKGDMGAIAAKMAELAQSRREKQPLNYPSCGSAFKRPEGHFAGKLIEDAGLKGICVGGAQVSEKHAGFIVNKGAATAKDIMALIALVQKKVYENSGIQLETEVKLEKES